MGCCVKLSGDDLSRYTNKMNHFVYGNVCIVSLSCQASDVTLTVTITLQSFPRIMAENHLVYGVKKLRHCHPMYCQVTFEHNGVVQVRGVRRQI